MLIKATDLFVSRRISFHSTLWLIIFHDNFSLHSLLAEFHTLIYTIILAIRECFSKDSSHRTHHVNCNKFILIIMRHSLINWWVPHHVSSHLGWIFWAKFCNMQNYSCKALAKPSFDCIKLTFTTCKMPALKNHLLVA